MSFKTGDKVVRTNERTKPIIWTIDGKSNVFHDSFACDASGEMIIHFERKELRYATSKEIKVGHRLTNPKN